MENKGFMRGLPCGSVSRWARGCRAELGGNNLYWPSCHRKEWRRGDEAHVWRYLQDRHYGWKRWIAFSAVLGAFCLAGGSSSQCDEAWVQLALMAASVASSIIGGAKSASAARKAQEEQKREKAKEDALIRRKRNEAYVDTAAGQRLLTNAREAAREIWKREYGRMLVGGGTDAATAMAKEQGNKIIGNTLSSAAANDTARQDKWAQEQIESDRRHAATMSAYKMQEAEATKQAAQQASNAMMSAAGSLDSGEALAKNTGTTAFNNANAANAVQSMRGTAKTDLDEIWKRQYATMVK